MEVMLCVEAGLSFREARELDRFDRKCVVYYLANQRQCPIDWKTGRIDPPKS